MTKRIMIPGRDINAGTLHRLIYKLRFIENSYQFFYTVKEIIYSLCGSQYYIFYLSNKNDTFFLRYRLSCIVIKLRIVIFTKSIKIICYIV